MSDMERLTVDDMKNNLVVLKDWVGNASLTRQDVQHRIDETIQALEELQKYQDLEEQGRLIKLPCKVGGIVYEIKEDTLSSTMKTIEFEGQEYHRHIPNYFIDMEVFALYKIDKFGKTVFLTPEEAEEKLKELEG